MKAIYIKPLTELVSLDTKQKVLFDTGDVGGNSIDHIDSNTADFFDERADDYDPFFDD